MDPGHEQPALTHHSAPAPVQPSTASPPLASLASPTVATAGSPPAITEPLSEPSTGDDFASVASEPTEDIGAHVRPVDIHVPDSSSSASEQVLHPADPAPAGTVDAVDLQGPCAAALPEPPAAVPQPSAALPEANAPPPPFAFLSVHGANHGWWLPNVDAATGDIVLGQWRPPAHTGLADEALMASMSKARGNTTEQEWNECGGPNDAETLERLCHLHQTDADALPPKLMEALQDHWTHID